MKFKFDFRLLLIIPVLFLLWDFTHSFIQYDRAVLDGDVAESVVPTPYMEQTMEDPLGIKTVINKDLHHNPNRFFSHWIFQKIYRITPLALQSFMDPIDSVYATGGITKLSMHILLIILIYIAVTGRINFLTKEFIIIACILTPLFQANGFVRTMGIIDPSVPYCFFYAMPSIFLILYFLPMILEFYHGRIVRLNVVMILIWSVLAIVICFSGPLNPGIVLIISMMAVVQNLWKNWHSLGKGVWWKRLILSIKKIPKKYYIYLLPISLISLYSLYVGTFNTAGADPGFTTGVLYQKLPEGLVKQFCNIPWLFLTVPLIFNFIIIKTRFKDNPNSKKLFTALKWVAVFSVIFILLLPLGGYRSYRPYVLRYDTIMPVTLAVFFLFAGTTIFLLKEAVKWKKIYFTSVAFVFLVLFTIADLSTKKHNQCEKESLAMIAQSEEDIVALPNDCWVLAWMPLAKPEESYYFGIMLQMWRVTDKPKLYYNSPSSEP